MIRILIFFLLAGALFAQRKHVSDTQFTGTVTGISSSGGGSSVMDTTRRDILETWLPPRLTASPGCFGDLCWRIWQNGGDTATTGFSVSGSQPFRRMTLLTDGTSSSLRYATPIDPADGSPTPFATGSMAFAWGTKTGWDLAASFQVDDVSTVRVGWGFDAGTDPFGGTVNKIALFLDSTLGATFRLVTCSGGSCTTTLSTVTPVANTRYSLRITKNAGAGVSFSVNGETPISVTANIPSVTMRPAVGVQATAAVVRTMQFEEFRGQVSR